ncbi:hypothetical protein [Metabacillus idriensis]|uniref:hypothetical protein n=1 Tax=Metabacillus idriensis TaxID=324768 RepID=UPI00174E7DE5|nr:hypothetical protein [Metabacillus idriensis]
MDQTIEKYIDNLLGSYGPHFYPVILFRYPCSFSRYYIYGEKISKEKFENNWSDFCQIGCSINYKWLDADSNVSMIKISKENF